MPMQIAINVNTSEPKPANTWKNLADAFEDGLFKRLKTMRG